MFVRPEGKSRGLSLVTFRKCKPCIHARSAGEHHYMGSRSSVNSSFPHSSSSSCFGAASLRFGPPLAGASTSAASYSSTDLAGIASVVMSSHRSVPAHQYLQFLLLPCCHQLLLHQLISVTAWNCSESTLRSGRIGVRSFLHTFKLSKVNSIMVVLLLHLFTNCDEVPNALDIVGM